MVYLDLCDKRAKNDDGVPSYKAWDIPLNIPGSSNNIPTPLKCLSLRYFNFIWFAVMAKVCEHILLPKKVEIFIKVNLIIYCNLASSRVSNKLKI